MENGESTCLAKKSNLDFLQYSSSDGVDKMTKVCSFVINTRYYNMAMLVLTQELDSHIMPNCYCTIGRDPEALPDYNSLGLLWPNFRLFYKRI